MQNLTYQVRAMVFLAQPGSQYEHKTPTMAKALKLYGPETCAVGSSTPDISHEVHLLRVFFITASVTTIDNLIYKNI